MYNPKLKPEDLRENLLIAATVLDLLNNLAFEREFHERLRELCGYAWSRFPEESKGRVF